MIRIMIVMSLMGTKLKEYMIYWGSMMIMIHRRIGPKQQNLEPNPSKVVILGIFFFFA